MSKLSEVLAQPLIDTKSRLEKKQAQTYEELLAEQVGLGGHRCTGSCW